MSFGLGRLGAGFGRGGAVGGGVGDPLAPGAVALTWDAVTTDSTPNFDVDLPSGNGAPLDAAAGDDLVIQYMLASGGAWTEYLTHTLDAGDIAGDPITISGVTPIANGDYLFRARLERGVHIGPWSASEAVTVNAASGRNVILVMRAG